MAIQPDLVGTITLTGDETEFTVDGIQLVAANVIAGDQIVLPAKGLVLTIGERTGATTGELTDPCPAIAAGADQPVRIRFQSDLSRGKAETYNLLQTLRSGNLTSFAELNGAIDQLPMFSGAGVITTIDKADLVSGVRFDAQVDTLAERDAYDNEASGFALLVSDVGDGRSALFMRVGPPGDWSSPSYLTGPGMNFVVDDVEEVPYGDEPVVDMDYRPGETGLSFKIPAGMIIEPGTVTTLAPGAPATVDFVPVSGGFRLDLGLPKGDTGDIDGVTPFWVTRLSQDTTHEAAQIGLGASVIGRALFTAADEAAVRMAAGATPVGAQIFTAADEAAVRALLQDEARIRQIVTGGDQTTRTSTTSTPFAGLFSPGFIVTPVSTTSTLLVFMNGSAETQRDSLGSVSQFKIMNFRGSPEAYHDPAQFTETWVGAWYGAASGATMWAYGAVSCFARMTQADKRNNGTWHIALRGHNQNANFNPVTATHASSMIAIEVEL